MPVEAAARELAWEWAPRRAARHGSGVAGLEDERWGQIVTAFVKRDGAADAEALDAYCRESGLANFKRPRRFVFVAEIPKSPVGKILRRLLQSGEYQEEAR